MSFVSGSYRLLRGGSWDNHPKYAQVANCIHSTVHRRSDVLGLRLVRRYA